MRGRVARRIGVVAAVVALLLLLVPGGAGATQRPSVSDKVRSGSEVTVPADETVPHDLYITGGTVTVDGRVQGDLVIAGGDVVVNGPVDGSLLVAAGNVTVRGAVGGHVRAAAGTVHLLGPTARDALAAAGTLEVASAARVGGDLLFAAGQTELRGTIDGGVLGRTGDYDRGGSVGGTDNVTIWNTPGLPGPSTAERFLDVVRRFAIIALFGVLLLWLAPRFTARGTFSMRRGPAQSLGIGLLSLVIFVAVFIGTMIVVIILVALLAGFGLGWLALTTALAGVLGGTLLWSALMILLAQLALAVAGLAIGRLLLERSAGGGTPRTGQALVLGAAVMAVLGAIPLLGWAISLLVQAAGFGALVRGWRQLRAEDTAPVLPAAP